MIPIKYLVLILFLISFSISEVDIPNIFEFVQIKYKSETWNTHPYAWEEICNFITTTTSIKASPQRKIITLSDLNLMDYPFIYLSGKSKFMPFTDEEIKILREYLTSGGFLFIEDASGMKNSPFDTMIRKEIKRIFPDKELEKIDNTHALFYSFYLLPKVSGVKLIDNSIYGITLDNQTVILYSQNDILGVWERDRLGKYLYNCIPNGEPQRLEAIKLTVNIIMYALTGSYKLDAVHSPFIKEKMKNK